MAQKVTRVRGVRSPLPKGVLVGNSGAPNGPAQHVYIGDNLKLANQTLDTDLKLADGDIFVGQANGRAKDVPLSGDATIIDTGAMTVTGLQGVPVDATAPTDTYVLTYVGADNKWEAKPGGGSGGTPGGTSGQIQFNNSGAFGGFTAGGDATINTGTGAVSVTKTGGVVFAASATTDTTNASNISSGVLGSSRGGAGTINGLLKANGSGVVSAAVSSTDYCPPSSGGSILYGNGSGGLSNVTIGTGLSFTGGSLSCTVSGSSGANPTATASDTAVNGTATTFMRSDGAPAVQKGSSSVFGIVKVDGTTIIASGGVISAAGGGGSGALTLISEVTTAGSQASVNFTSIAATYRDLMVVVRGRGDASALAVGLQMQLNGDTSANYDYQEDYGQGTTASALQSFAQTSASIGAMPAATATANMSSGCQTVIMDYRGTTFQKWYLSQLLNRFGTTSSSLTSGDLNGGWRSTAAITSVLVFPASGNFVNGSIVSLYGRM